MSYELKKSLYKSGSYVLNVYPKGDTTKLSLRDWVNFIDANGTWVL